VRVIRIFLSHPSDVEVERAQITTLVRDINETVQYLAPSQDVRLELVQHETHAFPDVGAPQEVIDKQIPVDYDLYLGIMWKRAGTPTSGAIGGTVHEFDQALAHRNDKGWPVIMFFFCDERIDFPQTPEDIRQLQGVMSFRERLTQIGYTVTYADRESFKDVARPRLLRGLANILFAPAQEGHRAIVDEPAVHPTQEAAMARLARRYDDVRRTMRSGPSRTREMTTLFNSMVELASSTRPLLSGLQQSSAAGDRLAAIAILYAFPMVDELQWLAERLDNPDAETPFVGFQASQALGQAARSLPNESLPEVTDAIDHALELARKLPSDPDRIRSLEYALHEVSVRRS
jgi:hypothetical protein